MTGAVTIESTPRRPFDLRGIVAVLPTPLAEDGSFDAVGMRAVIDFAVAQGLDGVLVLGSNGEAPYLRTDEKERVIETSCAHAANRIPVVVGIIGYSTEEAIHLAEVAERAGATALLVALSAYYPLGIEEVKRHYRAVCEAVGLPVLYYHFPSCTHLDLSPAEVAQVCQLDGIVGIKESVLDLREIRTHMRRVAKPGFSVFSGTTYLYPDVYRMGGVGVMCPVPLIAPAHARALRDALERGEHGVAVRHHATVYQTLPIMNGESPLPAGVARLGLGITARLGVPIPATGDMPHAAIKEALRIQNVPITTTVRPPLRPLDDTRRKMVHRLVRRLDPDACGPSADMAPPKDRERLQRAIDEIRLSSPLPEGLGELLGRFQILFTNNPVSRWLTRRVMTKALAFLLVRFGLFGVEPGGDARKVAVNWQKLAAFFKVPTVVEQVSPDEVVLVHPHCTMGYSDASHLPLCHASMNMDHEIVRRLGGELTILHRRLDGGEDCCRHRVRVPLDRQHC